MSLARATFRGTPLDLPGEPPYAAGDLLPWRDHDFVLPADDPFVTGEGDRAHAYLDGAKHGWDDHPEWMDFLDPDSPVWALKLAERDLVLHHWEGWRNAATVLDVGCGIGRFVMPFLDRGATVHGVDPDLKSLRRCLWHAAGRDGRLDLHWSSAHTLPDITVDAAICAEVLCYVPDAVGALRAVAERVKPGGAVLISVEARWGWAASQDAPPDSLELALSGDGLLDLPGDRWVQTYDEDRLTALIEDAGLQVDALVPSHWVPDGPLEDAAPGALSLEQLLAFEARCRQHPVWSPLHRLWLATAVKPG